MQVEYVKIGDFRQITGYKSKTVKDRRIVSVKVEESVCALSIESIVFIVLCVHYNIRIESDIAYMRTLCAKQKVLPVCGRHLELENCPRLRMEAKP